MSRRWQAQGYLLPLGVVLLLQSLVLAGFPGLDCTYNLWDRLSCSWDAGNQWTSSPCSVRAVVTDDEDNIMGLCSLPIGVSPRRCELYLNNSVKSMHAVTVSNSLHLTVTCSPEGDPNVTVTSCIPEWFPFYHLCLDPPQSLDIAPTPDGQWNLSWSCHHYLHMAGNREYEIQFKLSEEPWESLPMRQDQLWVPLRQLHPDTQYIAKVRVTQKRYRGGKWSDWSQPLQWRTPPAVSSLSGSHLLTQVLAPCIAVGIFLLLVALIIRSSDRIKKIFWVGVPDPSQFFDPLMSTHKGNFQKWLSSPFSRSSFSLDPTPLAISPVDISWSKQDPAHKFLPVSLQESPTNGSGHSFSSFSNQGYFFFQFPTIREEDFEQRVLAGMLQAGPFPSPNVGEEFPLFHADYLILPPSASLGVHNRSFEADPLPSILQAPPPSQEDLGKQQLKPPHPDTALLPHVERTCEEEEEDMEGEEIEQRKKESGGVTTPSVIQHHGGVPSQEGISAGGYLSLKDLYRQHISRWA